MSGADSDDQYFPAGVLNIPYPRHSDSAAFRDAYSRFVLPRLDQFKPDFILLSAGFDAHEEDEVNDDFGKWNEHDYAWLTEQLVRAANTHCQGKLVSVLEGGYCVRGGHLSPFAESVATHVRELGRNNPGLLKCLSEEELAYKLEAEKTKSLRKREMRVERRL